MISVFARHVVCKKSVIDTISVEVEPPAVRARISAMEYVYIYVKDYLKCLKKVATIIPLNYASKSCP